MRLNPDLFWAVDKLCQSNMEAQEEWLEYQAIARLVTLFIRVKKLDYLEEKVYAQARGKKPNTVQISYLYQRQLWDKPLQHQVVAEISPCLNAIKNIVTQWISDLNGLSDENVSISKLCLLYCHLSMK
jgi:hypothetical protein